MSVSFNNLAVVALARAGVDGVLTGAGETTSVLPDGFALGLYEFDPSVCPLTYVESRPQTNKIGPGAFDVTHLVPITIYHVRLRNGSDPVEEDVCAERVYALASYFGVNYRLGGNVQMVTVGRILIGNDAIAGAKWLSQQWQAGVTMASVDIEVSWIENFVTF